MDLGAFPREILYMMIVESALVCVSILFLTQPKFIFSVSSDRARSLMTKGGVFFLCATFCWSFILGAILVLTKTTIEI